MSKTGYSEELLKQAVQLGIKEGISAYYREHRKNGYGKKTREERLKEGVKRTKAMLSAYRKVRAIVDEYEDYTPEERVGIEYEFLKQYMETPEKDEMLIERNIKNEYRIRKENIYTLDSIERAFAAYRKDVEHSSIKDDERRYRILYSYYIDGLSKVDIADDEDISEKTVNRDIEEAVKMMAFYLHTISWSDLE